MKISAINNTYNNRFKVGQNNKNTHLFLNNECCNYKANLPSEAYKAYTLTRPSFKSAVLNINNIDLLLIDEKEDPRIRVELVNDCEFNDQSGLSAIYETAVHDQLHNLLRRNPDIKNIGSDVNNNSRKFDITCSEEKLVDTLKMIHKEFINIELKKQYIDEGKKLASVGYYLYTHGAEAPRNYEDVPKGMSQDDYKRMINKISYEDVQEYSDNFLNNSGTKIAISVNKKFYNTKKEDIAKALGLIIAK